MLNLLALWIIGGTLGWIAAALPGKPDGTRAFRHVASGAVLAYAAGFLLNEGPLHRGLTTAALAGAVAVPVLVFGLAALVARRRPS